MNAELDALSLRLAAVSTGAGMRAEMQTRVDELTLKLIGADSEQTRGAIKELIRWIDLPAALQAERDQLAAALSEQSDAAQ